MNNQDLFEHMLHEHDLILLTGQMHEIEHICNQPIRDKITELKTNLETARIAHNCAAGIAKKNIGISMTCTEYAISVLKELVE